MGIGLRPLHRHQHRTAPFAADADALNEAQPVRITAPQMPMLFVGRDERDAKVARPMSNRVAISVDLRPIRSP